MLEKLYDTKIIPISKAPDSISRDYDFVIILGPSPAIEETENQ